ncbi:MAG: glycosyltransferase [Nocardioides sp.]
MRTRRGVVHFFATLERGGAELRTLELLTALGDEARDHRVVTLARDGGALRSDFEAIGVATTFIRGRSPLFAWRLWRQVGDAAMFHTHIGLLGGLVAGWGRILGVPRRVVHFRSDATDVRAGWSARLLLGSARWMVRRFATDILGVSPGALTAGYRSDWQEDPRCRVLLSGLDLAPFEGPVSGQTVQEVLGVGSETPVVLHVGRDHPDKNRWRAIQVIAGVRHERPDAHLVFVGRDEPSTRAEQLRETRRLGIEDGVHWLGERHDVPALLRSAAATLVTSTREGLPGVIVESVSAGTPVIASDLPGCRLLAQEFPQDVQLRALDADDRAWAEPVLRVLEDPPDATSREQSLGRVRRSPFDRERCIEAYRSLWRVLPPARRRSRVVHLFSTLEAGGAEVRTLELLRELGGNGTEFSQLIFQTGPPGSLTDDFVGAGAQVVTARFRSFGFWRRMVRQLGRRETAALHLHVKRGNARSAVLLPLAAALRVPVRIAHFRSDGARQPRSRGEAVLERAYLGLIGRFATDILGVSPAALEQGWRSDWRSDPRCRVVLSGLPLVALSGVRPDGALRAALGVVDSTPLVMHVGRGVPLKNRVRAVEVLAALESEESAPAPHLVFVGRSGETEPAPELVIARDLGVERRVHLLGQRTDVPHLLAEADVLLLTSTQEGLPGVLVEALAVGTPAIASDLPGSRFVAERLDGVHVVGLDEDDATWADAVRRALARTRAERERVRASVLGSEFDVARAARAMTDIWRDARRRGLGQA